MYKVASASQYLVITGAGIKELKIVKKGWILPGQSCTVFDISPITYSFTAQVMSIEKRRLGLPFVYTIGPQADDEDSLLKYAKLISASDKHSNYVKELVQGIIEGETRAVAASLKFGDIFKGTQAFKDAVFEKVQHELIQFGLLIYNANVKQLVSEHGRLFYSPGVQARAENQARVDVAEAKMKGDTGVKLQEGRILQNAAKIDAETKVIVMQRQGAGKKKELEVHTDVKIFENKREAEIAEANAELAMKKAGWNQQAELASVEGTKAVALRESELQRQVEAQNALTRTEKLKAEFLSKASVQYDIKAQEANWKLYEKQKAAEAELYEQEKKAAAQRALASAALYARQQSADGELYAKEREAAGVAVFTQAQEMYVRTLLDALGGDYSALRDYMMINGRLFQDLALINVEAIQGLQPTISVWTTGNAVKIVDGVGNGASAMEGNGVQSIS